MVYAYLIGHTTINCQSSPRHSYTWRSMVHYSELASWCMGEWAGISKPRPKQCPHVIITSHNRPGLPDFSACSIEKHGKAWVPDKKANWLGVNPSPDSRTDVTTPTTTTTTTPLEATEHLFVIKDKTTPPYLVSLKVNGQPLTMEVDTGAAVSLVTESAVEALLPSVQLQPSNVTLKTYTGETIPVKGTVL